MKQKWFIFFFGVIIIFLFQLLAIPLAKKLKRDIDKDFWKIVILQHILGAAASFIIIFLTIPDVLQFNTRGLFLSAVLFAAITIVLNTADYLLRKNQDTAIPLSKGKTWEHVVCMGITVGISEELIFRGFIQSFLIALLPASNIILLGYKIPGAVIVSAALFGVVHMANIKVSGIKESIITSISAFILGIFLGQIYYMTGNLLAPMAGHNVYDFGAYIIYRIINGKK